MAFRIVPTNKTIQRAPRVQSKPHLDYIRALPCLICLQRPVDAAHIRFADARYFKQTGRGEKPDDCWTIPLCRRCHTAQHSESEKAFWEYFGVDPHAVALILNARSPEVPTGERIVREWNRFINRPPHERNEND